MTKETKTEIDEIPESSSETVPPADGEFDAKLMAQAESIAEGLLSNPDTLREILRSPPIESGSTIEEPQIDPAVLEAMQEFKFGTSIPRVGNLYAAYAFKYALDDRKTIVWDLILSPIPFEQTFTKWPISIDTAWGAVNEMGYLPWYKIVGQTYDEANKRIVPVKLVMMTPSFAFKEISAVAISMNITTAMILETIDGVETHRSLIVGEEARTAKKESKTYKEIVDRIYEIDYAESTENMLSKAKESDDKGDSAMASAFKVSKDFWTTLKENWCIVAFVVVIIIGIALQNAGVIG